jgi:TrmH family RNA methyltransferase
MISKNKSKFIKSLEIKKFRKVHEQFLVQGKKSVEELLNSSFKITELFLTPNLEGDLLPLVPEGVECNVVPEKELSRLGTFSSSDSCLAVAQTSYGDVDYPKDSWYLVLDDVRDPGNLGTIIRAADWYGIKKVVCSESCVDVFNPKVISATMGSFCRVEVVYTDLKDYLGNSPVSCMGALLGGDSIYETSFGEEGLIVMGNESNGIKDDLRGFVTPVFIPRVGGAESLNVAMATTVFLDNLRRGH